MKEGEATGGGRRHICVTESVPSESAASSIRLRDRDGGKVPRMTDVTGDSYRRNKTKHFFCLGGNRSICVSRQRESVGGHMKMLRPFG